MVIHSVCVGTDRESGSLVFLAILEDAIIPSDEILGLLVVA